MPQGPIPTWLPNLSRILERNLRRVDPTTETARREALVAPTLIEVCEEVDRQLNIEYPINVSNLLKGTLDYYIPGEHSLLVVEAKQSDLNRGFTQLAVELIALEQWADSISNTLYGCVTTGEDWRFGIFYRQERKIVQDLKLYRIPEELKELIQILIGILKLK